MPRSQTDSAYSKGTENRNKRYCLLLRYHVFCCSWLTISLYYPLLLTLYDIFSSKVTGHDTEGLVWPKRPTISQLSPLVWPNMPCMILTLSCAWPSPLWAYKTFSYVLCLSAFLLISFYHVPFLLVTPFGSILFSSLLFSIFPRTSVFHLWSLESLCI